MTNQELKNIKVGQNITFNYNGNIYTRKVQSIYVQSWNSERVDLMKWNVNKIDLGTGFESIECEQIIAAK